MTTGTATINGIKIQYDLSGAGPPTPGGGGAAGPPDGAGCAEASYGAPPWIHARIVL